jgi:hypothetical protein
VADNTPDITSQGETRIESENNPGHLKVEASIELPPGAEVQITIQYRPTPQSPQQKQVVLLSGTNKTILKKIQIDLEKIPQKIHPKEWISQNLPTNPTKPVFAVWLLIASVFVYYLVRSYHAGSRSGQRQFYRSWRRIPSYLF